MIYLATPVLVHFRERGHQLASILVEFIDDRGDFVRWGFIVTVSSSTFFCKTWIGLFLPFITCKVC